VRRDVKPGMTRSASTESSILMAAPTPRRSSTGMAGSDALPIAGRSHEENQEIRAADRRQGGRVASVVS
jgi:hypothetical protein